MIFFLLKRADWQRRDFRAVKAVTLTVNAWDHADRLGVAWNEIYGDMDAFLKAVLTAAKDDPVCQSMLVVAKSTYKLDLKWLETKDNKYYLKLSRLVVKLLRVWLSPMTGNITNWPRVRPTGRIAQLDTNWTGSVSFAPGTLQRLAELVNKRLYADDDLLGHKDEARFFYNITEAARAIIGEITAYLSEKLEKVFALRLVNSQKLLQHQRGLLSAFWASKSVLFLAKAKNKEKYEYLRYYLKGFSGLAQEALVETIKAVFSYSAGVQIEVDERQVAAQTLADWKRIPPVIACAILISDIPRICLEPKPGQHHVGPVPPKEEQMPTSDRPRVAFKLPEWHGKMDKAWTVAPKSLPGTSSKMPLFLLNHQLSYTILREDNFNKHAPGVDVRGVKPRLFGWVRNEYAPEVITYRSHLCPIWGGSSGHATGRIAAWLQLLDNKPLNLNVRLTIASSYAAFWRLYYDKRVSPVHLLVETFEATLTYSSGIARGKPSDLPALGTTKWIHSKHDDAFELVLDCADNDNVVFTSPVSNHTDRGVSPLTVWAAIKVEHLRQGLTFEQIEADLARQIDEQRNAIVTVNNTYWLPQWSHEKTLAEATAVKGYRYKDL